MPRDQQRQIHCPSVETGGKEETLAQSTLLALGSKWGQEHAKQAAHHVAAVRMNSAFSGQVGQESNLQPAVLEPRVREFMGVHAMSLNVATRHR
jgi:hypothetical protein